MVSTSRDSKYALGLFGVLAMVIAFPLGLAVLSDPAVALRLENGTLSPCTDMSGARTAAVSRGVTAGGAVVTAFASDMLIPITLVLAACAPFVLMSLFTLQLAF